MLHKDNVFFWGAGKGLRVDCDFFFQWFTLAMEEPRCFLEDPANSKLMFFVLQMWFCCCKQLKGRHGITRKKKSHWKWL